MLLVAPGGIHIWLLAVSVATLACGQLQPAVAAAAAAAAEQPTVGLAWSGGGITGFLASMCGATALSEISAAGEEWNSLDYTIAVNSGGTLGTMLLQTAPAGRLRFPPSWEPASYSKATISGKFVEHGRPGSVWFGAVDDLLTAAADATAAPVPPNSSWWEDTLKVALALYKLEPPLLAGPRPISAGVSLLQASRLPLVRGPSGTISGGGAAAVLVPAAVDLRSGTFQAVGSGAGAASYGLSAVRNVSVLAAGAMSSAFWAAAIIEGPHLLYEAGRHALIPAPERSAAAAAGAAGGAVPGGGGGDDAGRRLPDWYVADGGLSDTSGISSLLRQRVSRLVVFENKNSDLRDTNSTYAYLFGVATPTDSQNSLEGPRLAQVFPSVHWEAVIHNLTRSNGEPDQMPVATLRDLEVLPNDYFGVGSYRLESLTIVANQLSDRFVGALRPEVRAALDPRWPNKFEIGMPTLDANLLCVYQGWKVKQLRPLLLEPFHRRQVGKAGAKQGKARAQEPREERALAPPLSPHRRQQQQQAQQLPTAPPPMPPAPADCAFLPSLPGGNGYGAPGTAFASTHSLACTPPPGVRVRPELLVFTPGATPANYSLLLSTAAGWGFRGLAINFNNMGAPNSRCDGGRGLMGYGSNQTMAYANCMFDVEEERLFGIEHKNSSVLWYHQSNFDNGCKKTWACPECPGECSGFQTVSWNESIVARTATALTLLSAMSPSAGWGGFLLPGGKSDKFGNRVQWNKTILSGHSRGSAYPLHIAYYWKPKRLVFFCGLEDYEGTRGGGLIRPVKKWASKKGLSDPAPWVRGYAARSKALDLVKPEGMYGLGPFGGSCCTNWQATWAALGIPGQAFADDAHGALLEGLPKSLGGAHRIYLRGPFTAHGSPVQNCDSGNACCAWCGERQTSCGVAASHRGGNCTGIEKCECATQRPSDGSAVLAPVWKYLFTSEEAPGSVLPPDVQMHCCSGTCCSDPTPITGRPRCKSADPPTHSYRGALLLAGAATAGGTRLTALHPAAAPTAASTTTSQRAAAVMDGVKLLYNNDGENLWAVDSGGASVPYHPRTGAAIDTATIRGSARDVAGIADVDLLCPFHNVPWWNSTLEPPTAHRDWYDKTFGFAWGGGGSQLDYVLKGGDLIGEFAAESIQTGQKPFVTIRLNDGQMCSHPPTPDNCSSGVNNDHQFDRLSRFWWEHKQNASLILGLQQSPPEGWRPCCWLPPSEGGCHCANAACEFSWAGSTLARERVAKLVGELAAMYVGRGVHGVSLDFERGLDYFAADVPLAERRAIMKSFVQDVRTRIDAAAATARALWADAVVQRRLAPGAVEPPAEVALGVRLTPSWEQLRQQGLDDLRSLVRPLADGGEGITYINWGVFFWAYQPFDSDLASLVQSLPQNATWYYETTSWIGIGRSKPTCSQQGAKVRVTQEELWTTALLAHSYGAAGVSAFNFVYTRPYFDVPCQFELNKPYSEPLWRALNLTKDIGFLQGADQLYRLGHTRSGPGQIGHQSGKPNPTYRLVFVKPSAGEWAPIGRLRVLVEGAADYALAANVTALLNGVKLCPTANVSSQYSEGVQATLALFPPSDWIAFDVPSSAAHDGNNSLSFAIADARSEPSYKLSHDAGISGDGKRWKFPTGYEPHSTVNGTAKSGASLVQCEQLCDWDPLCRGIYQDGHRCFALHELEVDSKTSLTGQSYTRVRGGEGRVAATVAAPAVTRLELSLPVNRA